MAQGSKRRLSESVRTMRWVIVLGIFFVVITSLCLKEYAFHFTQTERVVWGFLLYACFGSLVTWVALTWVSRRIAEGERAKRKAREEETRLESVVSASADAILSLDTQGVVTSWNRGAELIFGYDEDEIVGQGFAKLVPIHIWQSNVIARLAAETQSLGYVRGLETKMVKKDGKDIIVEVTVTALRDSRGNITAYSSVIRDITERKEAEQWQRASYKRIAEAEREIRQLNLELEQKIVQRTQSLEQAYKDLEKINNELRRANEQLQQLDKMKSEFVSMVSHALRAPVTNINGALELLADGQSFAADDERKELLDIVNDESARLARLVQGVLTVSRIEGGKLELRREAVDLQQLCQKTIQSRESTAQGHTFSLICLQEVHPVWADPDYVEEVLVSLIDNAIKYSPYGGNVEISLQERDGYVYTSVKDEGIGIEEEELERVFKMFHRVDGSDSGPTGGYGLGLYISKRLVEAHGGTIEARSTPGGGSTLIFSMPIVKTNLAPSESDNGTAEGTNNR